ncbi:hypothetical protein DFH06DRAFT_581085 [Mycena polygramma]|nr:hypothetical protein DFH06DRAFT_581085 [Mycena polygramma]
MSDSLVFYPDNDGTGAPPPTTLDAAVFGRRGNSEGIKSIYSKSSERNGGDQMEVHTSVSVFAPTGALAYVEGNANSNAARAINKAKPTSTMRDSDLHGSTLRGDSVYWPAGAETGMKLDDMDNYPIAQLIQKLGFGGPYARMLSADRSALAIFGPLGDPQFEKCARRLANESRYPVVCEAAEKDPSFIWKAQDDLRISVDGSAAANVRSAVASHWQKWDMGNKGTNEAT